MKGKTQKMLLLLSCSILLISLSPISLAQKKIRSVVKGFDRSEMNTAVSPRVDFYDYAVGNWIKNNPIPGDYSRWGTFEQLEEENFDILKNILEKAAGNKNAKPGSIIQKVGDFYAAGMDTKKINEEGAKPILPEIKKIDGINSEDELASEIARLNNMGVRPIFNFSSAPDAKNSSIMIAQLSQGGLGLPDRDYYLKDDKRSVETRDRYSKLIIKMFELTGADKAAAEKDAAEIMSIEARLAKASMSRVERRNPEKTYNKMSLSALRELSPSFGWQNYFKDAGGNKFEYLNVGQPEFFKEVSLMMKEVPLQSWKSYLKWNLIRSSANYLSDDFVNASFDFYGKYMNGLKEQQPRWKRVLEAADSHIGEALGQLFVKKTFPPQAKVRAEKIVRTLLKAMGERISSVDWMSEATKKEALKKLAAMRVKIGYPDKWIDYSKLKIDRESYLGNIMRANKFAFERSVNKIDKPVDKTEWGMTPQTVNAYNSSPRNEIVFPAGILQPPFFDMHADDAINYGAMGAVIGHEITHGFDDHGRKYDSKGELRDWWTKQDAENFDERAKRIIEQFNSYAPIDTFHINGQLTQGENIADLGGLNVAFTAFEKTKEYKEGKKIDGFTPAQRFFLAWAQVWRNNIRDANLELRLKTDPHSPGKFRVNGPFSNLPEFYKAFGVKPGDPMERPDSVRVKIW